MSTSALRNNSSKYQSPAKAVSPVKNSTLPRINQSSHFNSNKSTAKGMLNSNEFSRQLRHAQNHAEENIEDEYIKNLQQQIAYMELELKLLKEKEMEQKQSVAQIDKFFNDGIPLNENILALKNQYNQDKKNSLNRVDELNELRMEELKNAEDLKRNYDKSQLALKTIMEALDKKQKEYVDHMNQTRTAYINERNRKTEADKELKKLQIEFRATNEANLKMIRDLERESVIVQQKEDELKFNRQKTADALKASEDWLLSLGKDVEKKRAAATLNPEIAFLESENNALMERQIRYEKEANMARAKVKEAEMFLESRRRERQLESQQKRDLMTKIGAIKFQIDEQNKMNEVEIKEKVALKEEKEKKDLEKEIAEVKTHKTTTRQRQQKKEESLRQLMQDKVAIQSDIMMLEGDTQHLDKEFREKSEVLINLNTQQEALGKEERDLEDAIAPIEKEILNMKKIIPTLEKQNEDFKQRIAHEEKKHELSTQLKNVNLEELLLLVKNNDQVQSTITDLMRKWDMMLRMNADHN